VSLKLRSLLSGEADILPSRQGAQLESDVYDMIDQEELAVLLGEIQTVKTKAQTALTMVEALRVALAARSADFEAEYVKQLEALLATIPPSLRVDESLRLLRALKH
jgi:UDP-N-acetylglucosamine transferase subunit ALG13